MLRVLWVFLAVSYFFAAFDMIGMMRLRTPHPAYTSPEMVKFIAAVVVLEGLLLYLAFRPGKKNPQEIGDPATDSRTLENRNT